MLRALGTCASWGAGKVVAAGWGLRLRYTDTTLYRQYSLTATILRIRAHPAIRHIDTSTMLERSADKGRRSVLAVGVPNACALLVLDHDRRNLPITSALLRGHPQHSPSFAILVPASRLVATGRVKGAKRS